MSDPLHDAILKAHSVLYPPGAFDVLCRAGDGLVQLRPDGPGRYLNCSVEIGCRSVLKPGCAKVLHGVMPVANSVGTSGSPPSKGDVPSKAGSASDGDDFIYD